MNFVDPPPATSLCDQANIDPVPSRVPVREHREHCLTYEHYCHLARVSAMDVSGTLRECKNLPMAFGWKEILFLYPLMPMNRKLFHYIQFHLGAVSEVVRQSPSAAQPMAPLEHAPPTRFAPLDHSPFPL
jgi:hypothetical protein